MPRSIALYDDENCQMHSYSTYLNNIITRENETIENIIFEIQHAIETETNNILLAKQNSTKTLST